MVNLNGLSGQWAVVTGASSGLGKEFAQIFAAAGINVILIARRVEKLDEIANRLRKEFSVQIECLKVDLSTPGSANEIFFAATKNGREITVVVNNAGLGLYGNFLEFSLSNHVSTIQVNSISPTEISYLFAKHMIHHKRSSYILQIASIAAYQPVGYFTVYSATKGYLRYFSETLAFELKNTNVTITCICPGGTYTEFFQNSGQKITAKGHLTMMQAKKVAELSISAMLKRETVYVPGILNKIACFLPRLIPRKFALNLAFRAMNTAVERSIAKT